MQVDAVGSPAAPVPTACTRPPLALPAPRRDESLSSGSADSCAPRRTSLPPRPTHPPCARHLDRMGTADTLTHAKARKRLELNFSSRANAGNALRSHEGKRATRGNACDEAILIR